MGDLLTRVITHNHDSWDDPASIVINEDLKFERKRKKDELWMKVWNIIYTCSDFCWNTENSTLVKFGMGYYGI